MAATAPAPSKFRDSCHACASSKVKCQKEKPTCSRCAKRGITCEYIVTKRAGRKHHENRSNNKTPPTRTATQALPGSSWYTNPPTSSGVDYLISPSLIQLSPRQNTPTSSSDSFSSVFSPIDPFVSSVLTNLSTGFDDFFASTVSFPVPEMSDSDIPTLLTAQDTRIVEEAVSELPNISRPHSPPNSRDSSASDLQSVQGFYASKDSPYCCLILALGLMKQLSPFAPTACTISNRPGNENNISQIPTIQTVIGENKQIIEAISNMLQCPCSQDSYLLMVMSLVVFKILGWYAAAARVTPAAEDDSQSPIEFPQSRHSSCHSEQVLQFPTVVGSYCLDGEDLGRMAAQLVLNELHRVQRLVNQLSQKLKAYGNENSVVVQLNSSMGAHQDLLLDSETKPPVSTLVLDQLETDLRKSLSTLSLKIIDTLRRD